MYENPPAFYRMIPNDNTSGGFSVLLTHLLVLDLQGGQAGLQLREAEAELRLELLLGGDLGHLTGSGTTTG